MSPVAVIVFTQIGSAIWGGVAVLSVATGRPATGALAAALSILSFCTFIGQLVTMVTRWSP